MFSINNLSGVIGALVVQCLRAFCPWFLSERMIMTACLHTIMRTRKKLGHCVLVLSFNCKHQGCVLPFILLHINICSTIQEKSDTPCVASLSSDQQWLLQRAITSMSEPLLVVFAPLQWHNALLCVKFLRLCHPLILLFAHCLISSPQPWLCQPQ